MAEQVKIFFCPKCRSKDVRHFFALRNLFGLIPKWECKDCNYQSSIFPQLVISKKKIKQLERKMKKENKKKMKKTKYCPKCSSKDIMLPLGGKLGNEYQCKKCGYRSYGFPEKQVKTKRRRKNDTRR
jgi:transposase-like protein